MVPSHSLQFLLTLLRKKVVFPCTSMYTWLRDRSVSPARAALRLLGSSGLSGGLHNALVVGLGEAEVAHELGVALKDGAIRNATRGTSSERGDGQSRSSHDHTKCRASAGPDQKNPTQRRASDKAAQRRNGGRTTQPTTAAIEEKQQGRRTQRQPRRGSRVEQRWIRRDAHNKQRSSMSTGHECRLREQNRALRQQRLAARCTHLLQRDEAVELRLVDAVLVRLLVLVLVRAEEQDNNRGRSEG